METSVGGGVEVEVGSDVLEVATFDSTALPQGGVNDFLKGVPELPVEDAVDDRVHGTVDVAQPCERSKDDRMHTPGEDGKVERFLISFK